MAIQLNPVFKELFTTTKRYILLTGGRGSSKTFNVSTFLCLLSYEKKQRILFTRYTLTSAETSIIPEFRKKIDGLEVPHHFNVNSHEITNTETKSQIVFSGIKASSGVQTAKLKGVDATTWVNDECEEFTDEGLFDDIDLSIRTLDAQNRIILVMNPSNTDHWIYKRWIKDTNKIVYIDSVPVEISTHPDVLHIHTTYLDNLTHLAESFLNTIKETKLKFPKNYGYKIIGQWNGVAEGAIFNRNELKTYKATELLKFESNVAYIDVADAGTDYTVCIIGQNIGAKIYITDIYCSDNNADVTLPSIASLLNLAKCSYVRCEANSLGAMYARNLQKAVPQVKVLQATSTSNKHTRILMDMPFIMEYFIFKHESERSPMYDEAIRQLCMYTKDGKAKHDDVPDAASGLAMFIRAMLPKYYL
jgi:PBSX family phage terminase large subunit